MKSDGDRGRAKNMPLLFWECRERKREQRLEVKRPGAGGTVERPSVDLSLCAVSLKSWSETAVVQQPRAALGANCGEHSVVMASTKARSRHAGANLRSCAARLTACAGAGRSIARWIFVGRVLCGEKAVVLHIYMHLHIPKHASIHPPSSTTSQRPHARCTRYRHLPPPLPNVKRASLLRAVSAWRDLRSSRLRHACSRT
jgi:hypothetical protein